MGALIIIAFAAMVIVIVAYNSHQDATYGRGTAQFGHINPALHCPHCQTQGLVRAKSITRKAGVSGAKATGALLTGGVSLLATGLSRKESVTQAHCDNCGSTWTF